MDPLYQDTIKSAVFVFEIDMPSNAQFKDKFQVLYSNGIIVSGELKCSSQSFHKTEH